MTNLIQTWNAAADVWWPWIVSAFWQSGVVAVLLLTVIAFARKWSSPVRYALLLIALIKFAVPPLWSAPTGLLSHLGPIHRKPVHVSTPAAESRAAHEKQSLHSS